MPRNAAHLDANLDALDPLSREFITQCRKVVADRQLTQGAISELSGLSQSHVSQILNAYHSPRLELVAKLADALGIDVKFMMTFGE